MAENRVFDTHVQGIKYKAVREIIKAYDEKRMATAFIDIPKLALPGPKGTLRCCIYKERAIFQERLNVVHQKVTADTKSIVEVIEIACDECPVDGMLVTSACRGCLSHKCMEVCPKDAIRIIDKHCVIDKEKCVECGKCVTACPYNAIIKQQRPCVTSCKVKAISVDKDKKAKINEDKCVSCGACVRQCPFGAIQEKSLILDCLDILSESKEKGFNVYAIVAPSIASQFSYGTTEQVVEGIIKLGFVRVVEAALGADVCLEHESHEWAEKGRLLTSCCPSFVKFVEKNFPEFKDCISSSLSPMVETAKIIKTADPTAKTVFIGPCASKKLECKLPKTQGLIDCVLSFEELQAFFDARQIDIDTLEGIEMNDATYFGRIFARAGGIKQGLTEIAKQKGIEGISAVAMSGLDECRLNLLKLRAGKSLDNFFEGMACNGGCVNGPLCLRQGPTTVAAIEKYGKESKQTEIANSVRKYDNGTLED